MPLSLNSAGLQTQTQEEIRDELVAELQSTFGVNINTNTSSILGQLVNISAEFIARNQQALLAVYRSFDPNGAIGVSLDQRAALTGSIRNGATFSVVEGDLEFAGIGTINNGDLIQNTDNQTIWELVNGPFTSVGPFPETISGAQFQAVDPGEVVANAGTAWALVTAVPGLSSFANPADDANLGSLQESDPDFRTRRNTELFARGQGPLAAITAVVSRVDGVLSARTYHNPDVNPADADGIPFKALNVVVETQPSPPPAALQQSIFDAIWSVTGAGGESFALPGATAFSGIVVDSEGTPQPVEFNIVDNVDVFITVDLVTGTSENAITPNIDAVVQQAILDRALSSWSVVGRDVLSFDVIGTVNDLIQEGQISGVDQVRVQVSRTAQPPSPILTTADQKVDIAIREKAEFDSVAIQVFEVAT